jgi:ribonuclease HII
MPKKLPSSSQSRGQIEKDLLAAGRTLAGVDEVGRGCLAGPVVAACTVLDYNRLEALPETTRALLRDSKTLSAAQRQQMLPIIREISFDCHFSFASVDEIERLGIVQANYLAMRRAIGQCKTSFELLLVDGKQTVGGYQGEQLTIVKGDNLCFAIAASAIIAKEARDHYMRQESIRYPVYGFDSHVGYGTSHHLAMIEKHGICDLHRRNFDPIRSMIHATRKNIPQISERPLR